MAKEDRIKIIKELQAKRDSRLICYITGDRENLGAMMSQDIVRILYDQVRLFPADSKQQLDIFLYSRGGDTNVPWQVVSMFRQVLQGANFNVLIPYRAQSAATMLALGADNILMGEKGELGPIDATIRGPYNPKDKATNNPLPISVEDLMGYFSLLGKFTEKLEKEDHVKAFEILAKEVHPLGLGAVKRLLEQTKSEAENLLATRNRPHMKQVNQRIVKKLSSELFSHHHAISRKEALDDIHIKHVAPPDPNVEKLMWDLFLEYEKELQLRTPFRPEEDLIVNNLDERIYPDLKIIYVESEHRTDVFKLNIRMQKVRDIPPQLTLNPQIQLPAINLPPGVTTPQGIAQFIQQWLQSQVPPVLQAILPQFFAQLMNSIPIKGFNRTELNRRWETE